MPFYDRLTRMLAWIAAALFALSGGMLTYEVIARYFFIRPTTWAAELSQLCLIWGSLIAMAWALGSDHHISVDALVVRLSGKLRRWMEAAVMLVIAVFSAVVFWYGWWIFLDSFERGRTTGSMLDLPSWIAELAVPVGFGLLFLQALVEFIRALAGRRRTASRETGQ